MNMKASMITTMVQMRNGDKDRFPSAPVGAELGTWRTLALPVSLMTAGLMGVGHHATGCRPPTG